jgi:hypothetical protein
MRTIVRPLNLFPATPKWDRAPAVCGTATGRVVRSCFGGRDSLARIAVSCASLGIALMAGGPSVAAESNNQMVSLASRSAIVVLGTVTKVAASEEPILAPTSATVVIKIEQMFAGSEFAGDQTGHTATVILSKPGNVKVGTKAIFFGNPRFTGETITIAELGELPASRAEVSSIQQALESGLQAHRDAPIRARLAIAEIVFRGMTESVRPFEPGLGDEHDPEWQVAMVRVTSAMRGTQNGTVIPVVFAASRDITWFNSPKPKVGEEALFIGHRPQKGEMPLLRAADVSSFIEKEHALLVTDPFDVLRPSDDKRVLELLKKEGQ